MRQRDAVDAGLRNDTSPSIVARPGRGIPSGGIVPALSRRITFSHTSASLDGLARSAPSSINPAVFVRWLWHTTQYVSSTARREAADVCPAGADCDREGATLPAKMIASDAIPKRVDAGSVV